MDRRLAPGIALAAAGLAGALGSPSALAARGPCLTWKKKPTCHVQTARVGAVDDGDTINVNIHGDGTRKRFKVRLTGVQAMELTRYGKKRGRRGYCHSVEAAERLEQLIRGANSRVRLASVARNPLAIGNRVRLRRSVAIKRGGRWLDVGRILLEEGLALWFPNPGEYPWNRRYSRIVQRAPSRGENLWNPAACGEGPAQDSVLRLKTKWDAPNNDARNLNGEWIRVTNTDTENAVSLARWKFRDTHLRPLFTFRPGTTLGPRASLRIFTGSGRNKRRAFYWGLNESIFENASNDRLQMGDGGYLFDPDGDLRAFMQYPCRVRCYDPVRGRVKVGARYRARRESISIRNVSRVPVRLDEYEIESVPWFYEFQNVVLRPRQKFVLWVGRKRGRGPLRDGWGHKPLLANRTDAVVLRNPRGDPVACLKWGRRSRCPRV
jgi:hypothetical protein